jgi:type II secretory pathway component PulC
MGLYLLLWRSFPLLIGVLVALGAWFQARAVGHLVGASRPAAPRAQREPPASYAPRRAYTSGASILARNPFDHDPVSLGAPVPRAAAGPLSNEDRECGLGRVVLILASDEASTSFATLEDGDGATVQRRIGDAFAGHLVHAIGWDRVWLTTENEHCQLRLGHPAPRRDLRAPIAMPAPRGERPASGRLPAEIAAGIRVVSETERIVERAALEAILERPADFVRSVRLVPDLEGDAVGLRVLGVRGGTLLDALGLENGDRIRSINGHAADDPQKLLEAYVLLRRADRIQVFLDRRGRPLTLEVNIK